MATEFVEADPGTGGSLFAGDNETVGTNTVFHPINKVEWGAEGSFTLTNTGTASFPIQGAAAENAAVAGNPVLVGGRYDSSTRTLGNGDVGAPALDVGGTLLVNTGTISVDATGQGDVPITLDGEAVVLGAGSAAIGKLAANSGVDIGDVDVLSLPGVAAEGAALGSGILLQGDDGTDRKNINVDATTGDVQVDVTNTVTVAGTVDVTNAGTFATQIDGDALTALQQIDNIVKQSDGTFANGDDGVPFFAVRDDALSSLTPAEGDLTPLFTNQNGALWTQVAGGTVDVQGTVTSTGTVTANLGATDNGVLDNIDTQTTPAQSMYRNIDANAEAAIKASAGVLHWLHVVNLTAAVAYLHLYDATTASVTPGSTTPDFTFAIPTQGDTNGAGFNLPLGPNGQNFGTAITLVCTTTLDGSAGDPGTNGVIVNAGYT